MTQRDRCGVVRSVFGLVALFLRYFFRLFLYFFPFLVLSQSASNQATKQASKSPRAQNEAVIECVKPSCKDRSEQSSAAGKSVEREDLQGLFVTTLEAATLPQLQAHLRGARLYTTKCKPSPHAGYQP